MKPLIGLLGGTFDPIHEGHLAMARHALSTLNLAQVLLIPAGSPWQRRPRAPATDRLRMAELAIAGLPYLEVDPCEIIRPAPTYTLDTLTELRAKHGPDQPFCLLLGSDAFLNLPTWYHWKQLLDLTHIAVLCRPGFDIPSPLTPDDLEQAWQTRRVAAEALASNPAGKMITLSMPPVPISSTQIRHALAHSLPLSSELVPTTVLQYIAAQQLYRSRP
ncbi:MAG: nicotinate-nucleotide adenylyltransferase [Betaproteobacteria bacterium]|jgi:nicotinate (nicotinamide) nucleotide adenylyltransferase|nr:nicotinate-nucleotide adenylyltransferase [Betaproteobacteria bacterium]